MSFFVDIHTHNDKDNSIFIKSLLMKNNQIFLFEDKKRYSIGIHPWDISFDNSINTLLLDKVKKYSFQKNILAIGETGLDFCKDFDKSNQEDIFKKHIEIANEVKKPLVIHCVKAYNKILQLKKGEGLQNIWIMHDFGGSRELAKQLIDKDIYLSFGKNFMRNNSKVEQSLLHADLNHIFFETDEEDYDVEKVYKKAANLLNLNIKKLQGIVYNNFYKIFGSI